jgi:hypothetical protein
MENSIKPIHNVFKQYRKVNFVNPYIFVSPTNPISSGLVAYWKLDSNSLDSTSNAHNGTNTAITYATGKIGNGASFNGTTSKIIVPDANDLSFTDGTNDKPFSISLWMKRPSATTYNILISKGTHDNVSNGEWSLFFLEGSLYLFLYDKAAAKKLVRYIPSTEVNTLIHLGATYDGLKDTTGIKMYKNGALISSTNASSLPYTGMSNKVANVVIGNDTAGSYPFSGIQDEIGLWNRVLTDAEMTELYNGGVGKTHPFI